MRLHLSVGTYIVISLLKEYAYVYVYYNMSIK